MDAKASIQNFEKIRTSGLMHQQSASDVQCVSSSRHKTPEAF